MKILIVQDTDWIIRNPIQHNHLAERLVLRGHEVRVIDYEILWRTEGKKELFSRRQAFSVARIFKNTNITVIRPGILKIPVLDYISMLFTYGKEIKRQLKEYRPDVIISNDILTTYLAFKYAGENSVPTIYYAIDIEHKLVPFRFLQPIGKIIEGKNLRSAELVIAINEGLREYTIRMGVNPSKALVLGAGIDTQRYDPGMDGGKIREQHGIKKSDIALFFMGWLYHFSGLKEVALQFTKNNAYNFKLLIVGDGDAFDELQRIQREHHLQDRVILTGKKPFEEIPSYIAASDICLLPAHPAEKIMQDIVPIKMYEYMAMKKPVIATRLPGIVKEFGENNGVVYINRPEETIDKARELVVGKSLEGLGSKARNFVERNSWDNVTDEFEGILKALIRKNKLV